MQSNPIRRVPGGYKWGKHGAVVPTHAGAVRQAQAAYAHGYRGNPLEQDVVKVIGWWLLAGVAVVAIGAVASR